MAKRRGRPPKASQAADGQTVPVEGGKENTSAFFREIFKQQPVLLRGRSNKAILKKWLKDHPGQTEVPKQVKQNLANIKSVLRSKKRGKVASRKQAALPAEEQQSKVKKVPTGKKPLERLEFQIDEAMILAKTIDRDRLASVIDHLRSARNEVVWKLGK